MIELLKKILESIVFDNTQRIVSFINRGLNVY